MSKTMTIADTISAHYNDDGQNWGEDDNGEDIYDMCARLGTVGAKDHDNTRFDFSDGSNLVLGTEAWDYGYPGAECCCWMACDHWCGQ